MANGGNAIDAAVAAAACLTVVEPTSNGLGGDLFAILHDGQSLHGLNASGRSPAAWTPERFAGLDQMPQWGGDSVTVPGCVAGWRDLTDRFGQCSLGENLQAAIRHARDGHPVSPITAAAWQRAAKKFGENSGFKQVFCPAPSVGDIWKAPGHARTLETIAADGGDSFYNGEIAQAIAEAIQADGGVLSTDDLAAHANDWLTADELLSAAGLGITLHEIPPNGQGVAGQMALQLCDALHFDGNWFGGRGLHLQVEAMKLAFADLHAHVADPAAMSFPPAALVDPAYAASRLDLLDRDMARDYGPGQPRPGGTVYLCAADGERMISLIQSNYFGFGSGVVVGDWGIALQNRGFGFVLDEGHPNQVGPRKRPFHTIIPGFVTQNGDPTMAFGVMGGPMQAQGHLQMMLRIFATGQDLQIANDAPRWQLARDANGDWELWHEQNFDANVLSDLARRGHRLQVKSYENFGGAQLIRRHANGIYEASSDPRKDGHAGAR